MADLYNKAQWIFVAGANKSGSIYGIVPVPGTSNVTLISASTFRSTSGSRTNSNGIIEGVAPHILRVDYPDLVTCPSYKFDPQRSNYLANSDQLATGSVPTGWSLNLATWSLATDSTSPVGTGLAGLLIEDTSTGAHYINNIATTAPLTTPNGPAATASFNISVYAKRAGTGANQRNIALYPVAASAATAATYFVLEGTGSVFNPSVKTYVSGAFIEPLPNGWYRCSVLAASQGQQARMRVYLASGSTLSDSYAGNGSGSVYIAGAQMEFLSGLPVRSFPSITDGTFISSYISSSADTVLVTRNADRPLSLPAPNNSATWSFFMSYRRFAPDLVNSQNYDVWLSSGSNFIGIFNNGRILSVPGGLTSPASLPVGIEHKIAVRISGSQLTYFVNGSKITSASFPAGTAAWNSVLIGDNNANTDIVQPSSFYVRVATMFSQSLSDAECISLTTTGSGPSIV